MFPQKHLTRARKYAQQTANHNKPTPSIVLGKSVQT